MEINALPKYDMSDNPTNCCPNLIQKAGTNKNSTDGRLFDENFRGAI